MERGSFTRWNGRVNEAYVRAKLDQEYVRAKLDRGLRHQAYHQVQTGRSIQIILCSHLITMLYS